MAWGTWFLLAGVILTSCGVAHKGLLLWIRKRRKVTEEQRADAIRQKKEMEDLIALPGWKTLVNAANAQVKYRMEQVQLEPELSEPKVKYMLGEVAGIRTLMSIPEGLIDSNDAVIKAAMEQDETGD